MEDKIWEYATWINEQVGYTKWVYREQIILAAERRFPEIMKSKDKRIFLNTLDSILKVLFNEDK